MASAGLSQEEAPKEKCAEPRRAARARSDKTDYYMQGITEGYMVDLCTLVAALILSLAVKDLS